MLLGLATLLCLISVPLAGGKLRRLGELELRGGPLLLAALALQVAVIEVFPGAPEPVPALGHVASYALLAGVAWVNRHVPMLWMVALGGTLNGIAIAANDGVMPAREGALQTAGIVTDAGSFENSAAVANAKLACLGDVFAVPSGWPAANVFSVGDVLIVLGVLVGLHLWCGTLDGLKGRRVSSSAA